MRLSRKDSKHEANVPEKVENRNASEQQKVTFLACALGATASIGGFIFGYVRCVRKSCYL